jgi:ABC-2 type transport system ATP-binding protein
MDLVVETDELSRQFATTTAVDRLTIALPRGGVIGLIGPNGSGKSTLIRMLLGLIAPSDGRAKVLGTTISDPAGYASRVGALVESPAYISSLTARAHLASLARLRRLDLRRVDEVLAVVGLTERARDQVGRFSLGMKQRLGIACALLPDPELLILDEPTNGLDPAGIVDIRRLLQDLGREGRTVIVSSHLLHEIQAVCDHLVVINQGHLLFEGPMTELLARSARRTTVAPEHPSDLARLEAVLSAAGWMVTNTGESLTIDNPASDPAGANRAAAAGGITLRMITTTEQDLEDVFLAMAGSGVAGAPSTGHSPETHTVEDPTDHRSGAQ